MKPTTRYPPPVALTARRFVVLTLSAHLPYFTLHAFDSRDVRSSASIARKIYIRGGIGTGEFRKIYGGRKRRGMKPSRSSKAAGGVIRSSLQQLEKLGILEKHEDGGRRLTRKGQAEMDTQAAQCLSSSA